MASIESVGEEATQAREDKQNRAPLHTERRRAPYIRDEALLCRIEASQDRAWEAREDWASLSRDSARRARTSIFKLRASRDWSGK